MRRISSLRLTPGLAARYDILCVDTEFTRLPHPKEAVWNWAEQAKVLSIGVSALDDRSLPATFYGARTLDQLLRSLCTPFVINEVLPALTAVTADIEARTDGDLVIALAHFLRRRADVSGKPPLLAVDWLGDAYLVEAFSGSEHQWLLLEDVVQVTRALGEDFPASSVRHNALHDAQAVRAALVEVTDI
jgi:hypothetical protein